MNNSSKLEEGNRTKIIVAVILGFAIIIFGLCYMRAHRYEVTSDYYIMDKYQGLLIEPREISLK